VHAQELASLDGRTKPGSFYPGTRFTQRSESGLRGGLARNSRIAQQVTGAAVCGRHTQCSYRLKLRHGTENLLDHFHDLRVDS
jgi:hypothetical protein